MKKSVDIAKLRFKRRCDQIYCSMQEFEAAKRDSTAPRTSRTETTRSAILSARKPPIIAFASTTAVFLPRSSEGTSCKPLAGFAEATAAQDIVTVQQHNCCSALIPTNLRDSKVHSGVPSANKLDDLNMQCVMCQPCSTKVASLQ